MKSRELSGMENLEWITYSTHLMSSVSGTVQKHSNEKWLASF